MQQVATVLGSLREVMLTVNLKKWAAGQRKVRYLGYHFGGGQKDVMVLRRKPITSFP